MSEKNFLHIDYSNGFDSDFLDPDDIYPFDVKFTEFNRADKDDERILLDENGVQSNIDSDRLISDDLVIDKHISGYYTRFPIIENE